MLGKFGRRDVVNPLKPGVLPSVDPNDLSVVPLPPRPKVKGFDQDDPRHREISRRPFRLSDLTDGQRTMAKRIASAITRSLGTYEGMTRLTIPAGISDIVAMQSLNIAIRVAYIKDARDAIARQDLSYYATLPTVIDRDINEPRHIWIQVVVPGTERATRREQEQVLLAKGMTFADTLSVALVAAAYSCVTKKADLFKGFWIRTNEPNIALATDREQGVMRVNCPIPLHKFKVAAAGMLTPSSGSAKRKTIK